MFDHLLIYGKNVCEQQFKVTYRLQRAKMMDHKKHRIPTSLDIMKELKFRKIEPSLLIASADDLLKVIAAFP